MATEAQKAYENYYSAEIELNETFNRFASNFCLAYQGPNTAKAQIGSKVDAKLSESVDIVITVLIYLGRVIITIIKYSSPFSFFSRVQWPGWWAQGTRRWVSPSWTQLPRPCRMFCQVSVLITVLPIGYSHVCVSISLSCIMCGTDYSIIFTLTQTHIHVGLPEGDDRGKARSRATDQTTWVSLSARLIHMLY